jgi:hypothetical protein
MALLNAHEVIFYIELDVEVGEASVGDNLADEDLKTQKPRLMTLRFRYV